MRTLKQVIVIFATILGVSLNLHAKDTALLIGLSYAGAPGMEENTLEGINLDIQIMQSIAKTLGFEDVRVLWDQRATYADIRKAFQDIAAQTGANDRILIYYSGHGSHTPDDNGDEADGEDEALVPYDVRLSPQREQLVRDDELGAWLDAISSNRILVIVDACHSGTGTRAVSLGGGSQTRNKYLDPTSARRASQPSPSRAVELLDDFLPKGNARGKFVSLMAARDSEVAFPSPQGSLFTVALKEAFDRAVSSRTCAIELEEIFKQVQAAVVRATAQFEKHQTPQLEAEDPVMKKQTLNLAGVAGCKETLYSERMQYWIDFAAQATAPLPFRTNAASIPVHPNPGSPDRCSAKQGLLSVEVTAPGDGYLTILNIGTGETAATVLFPNQFAQDNYVRRGQKIQIPSSGAAWCLPARLPQGASFQDIALVAAFTDYKVDLFSNGSGSGPFREVPNGSRSFAAEAGKAGPATYAASHVLIRIVR